MLTKTPNSLKTLELSTYVSCEPDVYFSQNILGPFILKMPDNKKHYLEIRHKLSNQDLEFLRTILIFLMPDFPYQNFEELDSSTYVYKSITINNTTYRTLDTQSLPKDLRSILSNTPTPTSFQLEVDPSCYGHSQYVLRYVRDTLSNQSYKDTFDMALKSCL